MSALEARIPVGFRSATRTRLERPGHLRLPRQESNQVRDHEASSPPVPSTGSNHLLRLRVSGTSLNRYPRRWRTNSWRPVASADRDDSRSIEPRVTTTTTQALAADAAVGLMPVYVAPRLRATLTANEPARQALVLLPRADREGMPSVGLADPMVGHPDLLTSGSGQVVQHPPSVKSPVTGTFAASDSRIGGSRVVAWRSAGLSTQQRSKDSRSDPIASRTQLIDIFTGLTPAPRGRRASVDTRQRGLTRDQPNRESLATSGFQSIEQSSVADNSSALT